MWKTVLALLCAGIGSAGFGIIFKIKPRHIGFAFLGGGMTWAVNLIGMELFGGSLLFANLCAALLGGLYAACCARLRKAPANVFTVPCLIPLVPGSYLYYAMSSLLLHEKQLFADRLFRAAEIGLGIAAGIVAANVLDYTGRKLAAAFHEIGGARADKGH